MNCVLHSTWIHMWKTKTKNASYSLQTKYIYMLSRCFCPLFKYFAYSCLSNHKIMVMWWTCLYVKNMYYIFRWRNTCFRFNLLKKKLLSMCIYFFRYKINEHAIPSRHHYTNTHTWNVEFTMKIIVGLLELHKKSNRNRAQQGIWKMFK